MRKNNYTEVEGWCEDEVISLYDKAIAEASDGSVFVEIGCYKGKSTCYMIDAIEKSGKKISFYVIDNFSTLGDVEKEFKENLGEDRLNKIVLMRKDSVSASTSFGNDNVDFLFIDTDHKPELLVQELTAWVPKIKKGGLIGGHDFHHNNLKDAFDIVNIPIYNVIFSKPHVEPTHTWRHTSWWFNK